MPGELLNLKPLNALRALHRHGSIAGAAQELRRTSPAIHTQLKNLEENLQLQLVNRASSGRMTLTEAGQILVAATERINAELDRSLRDIDALRKGKKGHVRLGVVSTGKYFTPALVADLKQRYPEIDIELEIGNREHITSLLNARYLHLAIMGRPPKSPPMESIIIGPHPHILIASPKHPLANLSAISPKELLSETFITREEGSGTLMLTSRYLDEIGDGKPFDMLVMGSNETIKQAVIAGLGIAILSKHTVVEELKSNRLVGLNLDGLPLHRNWYLLRPTNMPKSTVVETVSREITAMNGSFLPV